MNTKKRHSSSFRDPSGYIFIDEGVIKRSISPIYFSQYNALKDKNIFKTLFRANLLIPYIEILVSETEIVIQPEQVPFTTFPYEWSFNHYKEALSSFSSLLSIKWLRNEEGDNNYAVTLKSNVNLFNFFFKL